MTDGSVSKSRGDSVALAANQFVAPDVLPRPERRRHRDKVDRGLPEDGELALLAETYLVTQRQNFSELARTGAIPEPTPEVLQRMVSDFKERHRGEKVDPASVRAEWKCMTMEFAGGAYVRFSADNSNPVSNRDQLYNCLKKAAAEKHFVPWAYVYADYAVTGRSSSRQGYTSYKEVLSDGEQPLKTTYIDDFTRASRNELEWWRLANLSNRRRKRLIGASDGFDLESPDAEIRISVYVMLMKLFMKQLQQKVARGMQGAARRGTCLGRPPLGFTRCQATDAAGSPLVAHDGKPVYTWCHDPSTLEDRARMYDQFLKENMSPAAIQRDFNRRAVDGWKRWSPRAIGMLLASPSAIGVFIWNQTRRVYDAEADRFVVEKNPVEEWIVVYDPSLAIVTNDVWFAANDKLAAAAAKNPRTGKKPSRNQIAPSTLFSGLLLCGCSREITLFRSVGKHKQFACPSCGQKLDGSFVTTSKSVAIVEQCLLDYLHREILNDDVLEDLVERANRFLEQEAKKPAPDVAKLRTEEASILRKQRRLAKRIADTDDGSVGDSLILEMKTCQARYKEIRDAIVAAESQSRWELVRLNVDDVRAGLVHVREMLMADLPASAAAIRGLFGEIQIREEPMPHSKHGKTWIATFGPQWTNLLQAVLGPEFKGLGHATSIAMPTEPVEVVLEKRWKYQLLAPEMLRLRENGTR